MDKMFGVMRVELKKGSWVRARSAGGRLLRDLSVFPVRHVCRTRRAATMIFAAYIASRQIEKGEMR
jgi:hypothetical protein